MVYVFLAEGFEIVEAMAPIDMLTRAKLNVTTVGVNSKVVKSSCGVPVTCDITSNEFEFNDVDAIILPGGMPGTINLEKSDFVQAVINEAYENSVLICAICAAPSILGHRGLLEGKNAIAYPGFEDALEGAIISDKYVVKDGDFITARGAGVAVDFGLEIVKELLGEEAAESVKSAIQYK